MKNKALIGLIATATIGTAIATSTMITSHGKANSDNKLLMVNNINNQKTNEAVVINGNSNMNLYGLSNGSGIVSNLSTGEMLTILGQVQNGYCKVKVQETGAVGYIKVANMQNILNGTNDSFTQLSGNGQVVNVSSNVRLRSNPAIGNNIIGHLTNGTSLNILGKQGQWYKVNINGQIGFIYEKYVSTNATSSNNQSSLTSNSSNTSNVKSNLNNSNTSATSSSSSNSTSSTNSNNHVKNIIVRTKGSIISNSPSNANTIGNNISKNNSNISNHNKIMNLTDVQNTVINQIIQYFKNYDASQHVPKKDLGSQKIFYQEAQAIVDQYVTDNSLKDTFGLNGPTYNNIKINSYYSTNKVPNAINIPQDQWSTTGHGYYVITIQKINKSNESTISSNINNSKGMDKSQVNNHFNNGIINNTSSLIGQNVYPIPGKLSNVYKANNTKLGIVKSIGNTNTKMKILGVISNTNGDNAGDETWYKVELTNGKIGYVPQSFTYYKIIYTNPDANIPICLGPNEADQDSTVIKHEKIPMYVSYALSNVKNGGSIIPTTFYKVTLANGYSGFVSM